MYVTVRDNNVDQALRVLKKKMQREGVFREMKTAGPMKSPLNAERVKLQNQLAECAS